jgi:hypothetical protein
MTTPRPAVRLATFEDAGPIADLLADAFLDYEWSRWAVPADNRRERLRGLHLLYAGLVGAETGSTWVTDDISSVANWAKPGGAPLSDGLRTRLNAESAALFGDRLEAVDALDAETAPLRPAPLVPRDRRHATGPPGGGPGLAGHRCRPGRLRRGRSPGGGRDLERGELPPLRAPGLPGSRRPNHA